MEVSAPQQSAYSIVNIYETITSNIEFKFFKFFKLKNFSKELL
ncbi:MAG: hypothetical protein PHC44_07950 [Lutispora sp.]|nr:hypothetical protein [Lutispora sp.]